METLRADDEQAVQRATALLDAGELVVIPGDGGYLLAGDALDDDAVARVFETAGRAADQPLWVLVSGYEDLHHVAYGGPEARALALTHWPGPDALALRPRPWLPEALTAGEPEVRVLVPRSAFARALARAFGPLAVCPDPGVQGAALRVDAGVLAPSEAKVIRGGEPARS